MKNNNVIMVIIPMIIFIARILWFLVRYGAPFHDFIGTVIVSIISFLVVLYFMKVKKRF